VTGDFENTLSIKSITGLKRKREEMSPRKVTVVRIIRILSPGYSPGIKLSSHLMRMTIT
jgi:hypothetical protein